MDARNIYAGLDKGIVANRWVDTIQKDTPLPRGEYVLLTGSMILTLRVAELVEGDTGAPGAIFDTTIDIEGDDVERTGAAGTLGGP